MACGMSQAGVETSLIPMPPAFTVCSMKPEGVRGIGHPVVLIAILNHGNKEEGFAQLCRVVGGMCGGRGSDCLLQYALITADTN